MARRKLTAEEMAAKVAKMKATKAANKARALETLGLNSKPAKKYRKKRIMTDDQKAAACARLQKAREAKKPSQLLTVHESLRSIPESDPFAPTRVRDWIKNQSLQLKSIRSLKDSKDADERSVYTETEVYVSNLQAYLRTGIYMDNFWGAERQHKVTPRCVAMAYYKDGTPKRTVGVWYSDIGGVYTIELEQEDNGIRAISN